MWREYAEAVSDLLTQFTDWIANNYDEPIKRNLHPDFPTLFFSEDESASGCELPECAQDRRTLIFLCCY